MSPNTPVDPHLTALLAAAYRLGLAAGRGGGGGAIASGIGVPQVGAQIPVPSSAGGAPGGGGGGEGGGGSPFEGHHDVGHGGDGVGLSQLATQQNIAATLRDNAMRDALAQSEQRRQSLEIARWAQLASMRGTPTRSWLADTSAAPFHI
jgi:hypothetical protein